MSLGILTDPNISGLLGEILERQGQICLVARGSCMSPDILPGDTIVVRKVPSSSLQIGAIVLSASPIGTPVSHRIVGFTRMNDERHVLLRADQLKAPVETVPDYDVIGKVINVRRDDGRSINMGCLTYTINAFLRALVLLCVHCMRTKMVTLWVKVARVVQRITSMLESPL